MPQTYTSTQANYDFLIYILFGATAILLGIGAVRISLAMKKASSDMEIPSNRGGALFLSGSISAIVLTLNSLVLTKRTSALIPLLKPNLKPLSVERNGIICDSISNSPSSLNIPSILPL